MGARESSGATPVDRLDVVAACQWPLPNSACGSFDGYRTHLVLLNLLRGGGGEQLVRSQAFYLSLVDTRLAAYGELVIGSKPDTRSSPLCSGDTVALQA